MSGMIRNPAAAAIDLRDWHRLVAIRHWHSGEWKLLQMARLPRAIVICRQYPHNDLLIFPSDWKPKPHRLRTTVGAGQQLLVSVQSMGGR